VTLEQCSARLINESFQRHSFAGKIDLYVAEEFGFQLAVGLNVNAYGRNFRRRRRKRTAAAQSPLCTAT
jgi:hypothetical protein